MDGHAGGLATLRAGSEAGSATPSAVNLAPVSGRGRRSSATNRAVAAVHDAFPLPPSPSPLIRPRSPASAARVPKVARPAAVEPAAAAAAAAEPAAAPSAAAERLLALRRALHDAQPRPRPPCPIAALPVVVLQQVLRFVGVTLSAMHTPAATCRAWRLAATPLVRVAQLYPDEASIAALSREGSVAALTEALNVATRGQHLEELTIMAPRAVYALPPDVIGPVISSRALSALLPHLPSLTTLDVRGVVLRGFAPWRDFFLSDVAQCCPQLRRLRVGPQYIRGWAPQWWARLPDLREFVVGSRREDVDWHDEARAPLTLPEDFFAMLRSTAHDWAVVKVWARLAAPSFAQLAGPTTAFPRLAHLTINCAGNVNTRVLEEPKDEAAASVPEKKKADAKSTKKTAQEDAGAQATKRPFPSLRAMVLADVSERPEFATELLTRLAVAAPQLAYFTVVNTHRNAPGRVVAPQPNARASRNAAAAAASPGVN